MVLQEQGGQLPTIGVGKAMRDQAREGRRARARREERVEDRRSRTRQADWDDYEVERATCARCGCEDEVADMYTGGLGLVCAPCFSQGDGEIAAPAVPTLRGAFLGPLLYAPVLFAPHLLWLTGLGNAWSHSASWPMALFFLLWLCVVGGGMAGAPILLLFWAEQVKESWKRPDVSPEDRALLIGGLAWKGVSLPSMLGLALWWATLLAG